MEEVVPQVSDFPIASPDRGWDADAAVARIRRWASSDGSGEKDQIDWAKYRRAFLWYDESDPENFGSYALPYVDIIDGRPHIIPRAVVAIAAVLQGARGGFDRASREEIEAIRSRVAALYRRIHMKYDDFPEAPPWEREEESSSKNTLENVSEPMENPSSEPGKVAEQPIVVEAVGETAKVVEKKSIVESLMDFLRKGLREAVTGYPSEFSVARDAIYQELGIVPRLRRHVIAKDVPEGADRARFVVVPPLQFNATVDEATQALSFVDVTVTEVGRRQSVTYTDLEDSVVDLQAIIRNSFVRAAAYHEDRTIIDALATATGVTAIDRTGASPSTLTYDYLVEAIQTLKSKVKFALNSGDIVVLVHPKQYESLLKDPEVREVMRFGGEEPKQEGRIPMLAGARIVETDLVPSNYDPTTGNTDYTAILFVDGYSVGFAAKRDLRIEQERVPRERKVYYVATMRVGAKVLDPNSVVHLKTRNG
ncbi:MAG: phage major capsid protein [Nitrososphaerota archaeon]